MFAHIVPGQLHAYSHGDKPILNLRNWQAATFIGQHVAMNMNFTVLKIQTLTNMCGPSNAIITTNGYVQWTNTAFTKTRSNIFNVEFSIVPRKNTIIDVQSIQRANDTQKSRPFQTRIYRSVCMLFEKTEHRNVQWLKSVGGIRR